MFQNVIQQITSNPILLIIIVAVLIVLAITLLKKLFKLALFALLIAAAIVGYVWFTSDNPQQDVRKLIDKGTETVKQAAEKAQDIKEDVQKGMKNLKKITPDK